LSQLDDLRRVSRIPLEKPVHLGLGPQPVERGRHLMEWNRSDHAAHLLAIEPDASVLDAPARREALTARLSTCLT
jgi:hypothetical protein